jgi:DNA-binding PadR family transcriptional regulator
MWAARRFGRHSSEGPGFGRGGGRGGGDWFRVGRMLAQGDLKLLALALIAEQPRHGYELIKLIEEKTSDCYSPSPGVIYPTLTFLEEAGYVTAESEGAKKRYTITEDGRAYLEENRDVADMVLARLAAIGSKVARMRRRWGEREDEEARQDVPKLVDAALDNLRAVTLKRLETDDAEAETRIVEILARAAQDIRSA